VSLRGGNGSWGLTLMGEDLDGTVMKEEEEEEEEVAVKGCGAGVGGAGVGRWMICGV